MTDMNPCKKCGGNPVLLTDSTHRYKKYKVICSKCGRRVLLWNGFQLVAEIVWNRRNKA